VDLAETLALMGRTQEADWQFRFAAAISPLSTRALNSYGNFLFDAGRMEEARVVFERSVKVDTTFEAYDRLGDIYVAWQDTPRAAQALRHAIGANPFDGHAHIALAEILESSGRPKEALQEYESGLETNPLDPVAKAAVARLRADAAKIVAQ
jgi:Tfp pilus assembly protein PilF